MIDARVLPRRHIEKPGLVAVRRRIPVGGALHRRPHPHTFPRRGRLWDLDGSAVLVQPLGPRHLDEVLAVQEFARNAIQHVEEAVAVGPQHQLAWLALPLSVHQHRNLHRVPVPLVVRRELEVPFQLARVGVERHHRVRVQVVAWAHVAIPVRSRISHAPIGQVQFGIVRPRDPDRPAAALPRIAGPRFVARFARTGNRVEAPDLVAILRVQRHDEATDAVFATGRADDDLVSQHQGGVRQGISARRVDELLGKDHRAVLGIQRDHLAVDRAHVQGLA